jgi:hypothetical protein
LLLDLREPAIRDSVFHARPIRPMHSSRRGQVGPASSLVWHAFVQSSLRFRASVVLFLGAGDFIVEGAKFMLGRNILAQQRNLDPEGQTRLTAFRQRTRQLGWVEGHNVQIDYRWTVGSPDRARTMAAELVAIKPDVTLVTGATALLLLQERSSGPSTHPLATPWTWSRRETIPGTRNSLRRWRRKSTTARSISVANASR